jgi:Na+/H+ antiporter NhaD/arsenite permease-like protein
MLLLDHCCRGRAIIIKYYKCVCMYVLAFVVRHVNLIFSGIYFVICGMPGSTILFFLHFLTNDTTFGRHLLKIKMSILIFFTTLSETFSF